MSDPKRAQIVGLTLQRPWAWAMTRGPKRIENRSWWKRSLLGNYVALHAGKTWDYEGAEKIVSLCPEMPRSAGDHPLGIVGVGRVTGMVEFDGVQIVSSTVPLPALDRILTTQWAWLFGRYGLIMEDIVAFTAVPCRGMQGLWPLPEPVLRVVRERWKEGAA